MWLLALVVPVAWFLAQRLRMTARGKEWDVQLCMHACMSVPEFNVRYLLQLFFLLIFETSLIEPKTYL